MARRYVPYGQRFGHEVHRVYPSTSRFSGPIERTPHIALIWRSMPMGVALFALFIVAGFAIVAFSAASSVPSRTEAPHAPVAEAGTGRGSN